MTLWHVFRALVRWWPVVAVGVLLTVAAGYLASVDRGVYYTRTEVAFLAPSSKVYPNSLSTTSEGLIVAAGTIGKQITGPGRVGKFASPDVNLVGLGIRDGWTVRLPDTGGQWAPNFADQMLIVEVVGPDPDSVAKRQQELVDLIGTKLQEFQRDAGVDPVNYITSKVTPESAVVYRIGGSRVRALGMTLIIGCATTLGAVSLLETRARRRQDLVHDVEAPNSPEPQGSRV